MAKTFVIATTQVEGLHRWPGATVLSRVSYLKYPHRHMFHITAMAEVSHDDRDIEIITLKHGLEEYLKANYYNDELKYHWFDTKSCEQIAKDLLEAFNLFSCRVMEDGEGGALVCK